MSDLIMKLCKEHQKVVVTYAKHQDECPTCVALASLEAAQQRCLCGTWMGKAAVNKACPIHGLIIQPPASQGGEAWGVSVAVNHLTEALCFHVFEDDGRTLVSARCLDRVREALAALSPSVNKGGR